MEDCGFILGGGTVKLGNVISGSLHPPGICKGIVGGTSGEVCVREPNWERELNFGSSSGIVSSSEDAVL